MNGKFGVVGSMDGWEKGDCPNNQMINIVLNNYSTLTNGNISLTCELATDDEVDFAINQLIKDLEIARKKAKTKISKTNKKIRGS